MIDLNRFLRLSKDTYFLLCCCFLFCISTMSHAQIITGAARPGTYLPLLHEKKVAVVANQSSLVKGRHLVDELIESDIKLVKVFVPEHGFRGKASAGEEIKDAIDKKTGLPLRSLYGKNKKPKAEDMKGIDAVVFDLQDVGVRCYTYISTLHYIMEACAENRVKLVVLDRPNPNGHYIDGPVLDTAWRSFVGMHPVPLVHGMTIGEYAQMINGEHWLNGGIRCELTVVSCKNYNHKTPYELPVRPSPNLPNSNAVALYPSLCLFEGTVVSIGRGTDKPFQIIGAPYFPETPFSFTPKSREEALKPKYENERCNGYDLSIFAEFYIRGNNELYLFWLLESYSMSPKKDEFFNAFFDKLAGGTHIREQIEAGKTEAEIRNSWKKGLTAFKQTRRKYLLYRDFE